MFLAEQGARLAGKERGWLQAQHRTWISVWEVEDVEPSVALLLRDRLTGERRRVLEVSGSEALARRDGLLARVVDFDGLSVLCGIHPTPLGPRQAEAVVLEARRVQHRRTRAIPIADMRDPSFEVGLVGCWNVVAEERRNAPLPTLQNTDGDPLLLTVERFSFDPERRADLESRLCTLEGAEREEEAETAGPTSITFLRLGWNEKLGNDNTIVGHAEVDESTLRLETNSLRRADALRARVERACGSLVRFQVREHSDPHAQMARGAASNSPSRHELTAEEIAALRAFKAQHYRRWLDEPLPALMGRTPREAVKTAGGKRDVDLLLCEIENHEARARPEARLDIRALRRELGL